MYARGINRLRHFYLQHAPELAPDFIQTDHDDLAGMLVNAGVVRQGSQQAWFTTAGAIGVITSVLIGWCAAGVLAVLPLPPWLLIAGGGLAFGLAALSFLSVQRRAWREQESRLPAQFPTFTRNTK
ncbi:hypothetical protein E7T06_18980 [Deinococcus sp. Arct2-2]|uniref:hypothetical protein n=1 Tax=Deinococcus sp. Arct2-2 TaxID=2568653 RepID=UPI0010A2FFEF|nr:hypothetical protein [Deinococcus sp. Arct2-2]THF67877.1 hypothetical protein E7T06_18980 [Deinococcus sp. Arct2-2]